MALENQMSVIMKAVALGRSLRANSKIKVRQPLSKYVIVDRIEEHRRILKENLDIIREELNVKNVSLQADESELVSYSAKANFKVLGKKLGKNMKEVAAKIQEFHSAQIAQILDHINAKVGYSEGEIEIGEDDIVVQRSEAENVKVLNEGDMTVGYDTEITPELTAEGIARDVVRLVQTTRKESGLEVADHINLTVYGSELVNSSVEKFRDYISGETLADTLVIAANDGVKGEAGDEEVTVTVVKA